MNNKKIILVTGCYGFVGSQILSDLIALGHPIICCARNAIFFTDSKNITFIKADFSHPITIEEWQQKLQAIPQIDVLINCVGLLQGKKEMLWNVHYYTPKTLIEACLKKGLAKVIQISALGVDKYNIPFATSKKKLDEYLLTLPISCTVLRPSLIYGKGSYGGTSLFRGIAGLPGFMPVVEKGEQRFQPIHIKDLSQAVLQLMNQDEKKIYAAVGPEKITFWHTLKLIRNWLGLGRAIKINIPNWIIKIAVKLGDVFRTTINSTLYQMMLQDNVATSEETTSFHNAIGFTPKKMSSILTSPSYVQDRWHARLYFLRPMLRLSLAFLWIFTAITSLFLLPEKSFELLEQLGITQPTIFLYGASTINFMLGLATLFNYKLKWVGSLQIAFILIYTVIITIWLPAYWLDPFGAITKNIPIIVATLVMMALESKR